LRSQEYTGSDTLARQTQAWLEQIRASVAPRPQLQLDPARCALLVVDMLRYFVDPEGRCYLPAGEAIIPRIAALLESWRGRQATVIFTQHAHEGQQDLGMLGRFFSDYIRAGEAQSEIVAALAPRPGEPVIRKTTYDAFWQTSLPEILAARGCGQILVTGVLTHMCCETTARSAFCRGLEVYVAADGTASSSAALHLGSLHAMADAVAIVLGVDEILARCGRRD
jgi:bifunctional isochorismate lyase/aryl carrier protein